MIATPTPPVADDAAADALADRAALAREVCWGAAEDGFLDEVGLAFGECLALVRGPAGPAAGAAATPGALSRPTEAPTPTIPPPPPSPGAPPPGDGAPDAPTQRMTRRALTAYVPPAVTVIGLANVTALRSSGPVKETKTKKGNNGYGQEKRGLPKDGPPAGKPENDKPGPR